MLSIQNHCKALWWNFKCTRFGEFEGSVPVSVPARGTSVFDNPTLKWLGH
jgi:hypothetical protein